jgi:hypothetical protein
MLIEPGVEVNNVVYEAPTEADGARADLREEGRADAQVGRRVLPGEAPRAGQRQSWTVIVSRHPWPSDT